jgi:hypothetical protein
MKYIAISKDTDIKEINLDEYNFIFLDKVSLEIFCSKNENVENRTFLVDDSFINSEAEFFVSNKDIFIIYVVSKLLDLGIKNIFLYESKLFPKELIIYDNNIFDEYNELKSKIKIDNILKIDKNLFDISNSSVLAKIIYDNTPKIVAILVQNGTSLEYIYELCFSIKLRNQTIKIAVYGDIKTPKRVLMSNAVDFVLVGEDGIDNLLDDYKQIPNLYYYDENLSVKINK